MVGTKLRTFSSGAKLLKTKAAVVRRGGTAFGAVIGNLDIGDSAIRFLCDGLSLSFFA
jgi:hypothetical protein